MTRTYKATGINLKSAAMGESDRVLTILTREFGLIRAVAPGVRKQRSTIGGRSELFVVNELLIAKGRSLDKITQADTVQSHPGLSRNLGKLSAAQYLAELAIASALSDEPQEELFWLLGEHLSRLERLSDRTEIQSAAVLVAHLTHGIFHLLALAGLAPQVQVCCATRQPLIPNFTDPNWQTGFSIPSGGTFSLSELANLEAELSSEIGSLYKSPSRSRQTNRSKHLTNFEINANELAALQQLASPELGEGIADRTTWVSVENILRQYAQYHLGCTIRSGSSIDTYLESFEF
ncbi:DNA repair protein RecO [Microcoleus vaginatus DQ-U2]|uniref:DNA repair protein RecO n=1 Tax=Microcoleus vaginatus TaxID=119532 RepID=UPI0016839E86|nr:DNA repair protein RecO [Microcoleus sp. FACHB-DQ6]